MYVFTVCFLLSGATGLTYEILWSRSLSLIFGTTHLAVTTVLAAYMGGLAFGSWLFGRYADRTKDHILIYGLLEIGVGLYAFMTPHIFTILGSLHGFLYNRWHNSLALFGFVRVLLCLLILIIPTVLMGGTLPLLSRFFIRSMHELTNRLGFLYGLNTLGAFLGTMVAGFVSIRFWGMTGTLFVAVAINVLIGLLALFMHFLRPIPVSIPSVHDKQPVDKTNSISSPGVSHAFAIMAYFTAGFAALLCEVGWTRGLTLVLGSSIYAFTIMLATFLAGIGLGSWVIGFLRKKIQSPIQVFAFIEIVLGIFVLLSIVFLGQLPVLYLDIFFKIPHEFVSLQFLQIFLAGCIMVVPTLLMGAAFPVIGAVYIDSQSRIGRQIGDLYSINTLGGIAGSALSGFVLIPIIGTRLTLIIGGALFLCIGMSSFLISKELSGRKKYGLLAALAALFIVLILRIPTWDPLLLTSGVYVYASEMKDGFEGNRKFLFFEEGIHSLVAVTEKAEIKSLRINGKTDGSNGEDMITQILLAYLPLSLHPNPQQVMVIGFGTGVTAGAALSFDIAQLDCVEIDMSVIRASDQFAKENKHALQDKRMNLLVGDARTVLASSPKQYDIIIAEPSNPWITGVSNLFTVDQFELYKNQLNPHGILCQWIHSYFMRIDDLKMIFRSLMAVFPEVTLWQAAEGDFLLIASVEPNSFSTARFERLLTQASLQSDFHRLSIANVQDLYHRQLLTSTQLKHLSGEGLLNTDDHPIIEFSAPTSIYQATHTENLKAIEASRNQ